MNKPKRSEKKMLSVKFYRNLRRNLFYGIYFNKFHNVNVIIFRAVGFMYKIYKKGALDSQLQMIKFTICLPVVGGSLRLLPPLKVVAMI
jgi:hypothetical protein